MSEPKAYVLEHLRAAIQQPPVAELGLELSIDADDRIRVAGPVCSDEQRAAIVDAIRAAAPDAVVVDALTVSHRSPDTSVEDIG